MGAFVAELSDLRGITRGGLGAMAGVTLASFKELQRLWRSGTQGGIKTLSKKIAELYLEWAFAVKPLADDVATAAAAIEGLIETTSRAKVKIKGTGRNVVQTIFNEQRDFAGCAAYQLVNQLREESVVFHGKVMPTADPLGLRRYGMHGDNGMVALWEGLPFSFLADYVSNAQEKIESSKWWWTRLCYLVEGHANVITTTATNGILKNFADPNIRMNCSGGAWTSTAKRVFRTATTIPNIDLQFEIPGGSQVANIAALMVALGTGNNKPPPPDNLGSHKDPKFYQLKRYFEKNF